MFLHVAAVFLFLPVHLSLQQGPVVLEGQDVQEDP